MRYLYFLNKKVIFTKFFEGDVSIFSVCKELTPSKYSWGLYAHRGIHTEHILYGYAGKIETNISNNSIYIIDCDVKITGEHNGRILYSNLLEYVSLINKHYPISKLHGFLSPFDYSKWLDLINFYYNLRYFIIPFMNTRIDLNFKLRDYEINDFIETMEQHSNERVNFDIYITYP